MTPIFYFSVVFSIVFLTTLVGVYLFRQWSLRNELFDLPNERSSHTIPTPRGGGIVVVTICLLSYAGYTNLISGNFSPAYFFGALIVSLISWLDDLYDVSFIIRILMHGSAAALIIYFVGFFEYFYLPIEGTIFRLEFWGIVLTFFWLIWLTNAFNFMDGIDGIAGLQTFTAAVGWMIICFWFNLFGAAFYSGVIAFAGLGFLVFNWQPAKIFMGDVGSAFLGFTFAVIPLLMAKEQNQEIEILSILPLLAVLLNWFFIFDTIYTLFRRIFKGEKIWKAHRSHLYQKLTIAGFQHRTIALLYGLLTISVILLCVWRLMTNSFFDYFVIFTVFLQTSALAIFVNVIERKKINTTKL